MYIQGIYVCIGNIDTCRYYYYTSIFKYTVYSLFNFQLMRMDFKFM